MRRTTLKKMHHISITPDRVASAMVVLATLFILGFATGLALNFRDSSDAAFRQLRDLERQATWEPPRKIQ